jgi:hypothetical protein
MNFSAMRVFPLIFLTLAMFSFGCAGNRPAPGQAVSMTPYEQFPEALKAIGEGDLDRIMELRVGQAAPETIDFLQHLYSRYGRVHRIHALFYREVDEIHRGTFIASHEGGPFLWDLIRQGNRYRMVRGTTDVEPMLEPATPPAAAVEAANRFIDGLNEGDLQETYGEIVCGCLSFETFSGQTLTLLEQGGKEKSRRLVGAMAIPGLEENLSQLHFLSERDGGTLGFHFILWNVNGEWKLNAVQWSQEELLPRYPLP